MSYSLGMDIGSTTAKAALIDENGNVQAQKVWKMATYPSTTSDTANYNDLYYFLLKPQTACL